MKKLSLIGQEKALESAVETIKKHTSNGLRKAEKDMLIEQLQSVRETLRYLRKNEAEFKAFMRQKREGKYENGS